MPAPTAPSAQTRARSQSRSSRSVSSVQLPLETRPADHESAVEKLVQRPPEDLRRARKHHRRALKALREGAYEALPEDTREQLIARFSANLDALNDALDARAAEGDNAETATPPSLFRKAFGWLW